METIIDLNKSKFKAVDALYELVTNAFDAECNGHPGLHCSNGEIVVNNEGEGLSEKVFTSGSSGGIGIGLKDAIATFIREGAEVKITSCENDYSFLTKIGQCGNETVHVSVHPPSRARGTSVTISGLPKKKAQTIYNDVRTRFLVFCDRFELKASAGNVQAFKDSSHQKKYNFVFIKGVKKTTPNLKFAYAYNFLEPTAEQLSSYICRDHSISKGFSSKHPSFLLSMQAVIACLPDLPKRSVELTVLSKKASAQAKKASAQAKKASAQAKKASEKLLLGMCDGVDMFEDKENVFLRDGKCLSHSKKATFQYNFDNSVANTPGDMAKAVAKAVQVYKLQIPEGSFEASLVKKHPLLAKENSAEALEDSAEVKEDSAPVNVVGKWLGMCDGVDTFEDKENGFFRDGKCLSHSKKATFQYNFDNSVAKTPGDMAKAVAKAVQVLKLQIPEGSFEASLVKKHPSCMPTMPAVQPQPNIQFEADLVDSLKEALRRKNHPMLTLSSYDKEEIHAVTSELKSNLQALTCISIDEVRNQGSIFKNTGIPGFVDVDIVLILNEIRKPADIADRRAKIVDEMKQRLPGVDFLSGAPDILPCQFKGISFDLVLTSRKLDSDRHRSFCTEHASAPSMIAEVGDDDYVFDAIRACKYWIKRHRVHNPLKSFEVDRIVLSIGRGGGGDGVSENEKKIQIFELFLQRLKNGGGYEDGCSSYMEFVP
jgi:hypothetical protein